MTSSLFILYMKLSKLRETALSKVVVYLTRLEALHCQQRKFLRSCTCSDVFLVLQHQTMLFRLSLENIMF